VRDRISALSLDYVGAPVAAQDATGVVDPSSLQVELSYVAAGNPVTWVSGTWERIDGRYWAVALVGPGSTFGALAPGRYSVWVKVTSSPEVPVLKSPNQITVF
jgi:hypothetical protein